MNQILERCVDCRGTAAESMVKWDCLPVRTFGGLPSGRLRAITVGLNPALNDWLAETMREWRIPSERAAIVSDYKKKKREDLTDENCADAARRRGKYFWNPNKKWAPYFESMEALLARIDRKWSYVLGTVAHVDLIACPTKVRFRKINEQARAALLNNCQKHFLKTLDGLPESTVLLLNGDLPISQIKSSGQILSRTPTQLVNVNGLSGISGWVQIGTKKFVVCGWSQSAAKLSPPFKLDLAHWVRNELKNQDVRFD
jgi:hypothetical protein